ncbi:MAG: hypothetical protein M1838_006194 [Thelocarpon superellum]|nr:MAG: hypothetical protein M1838_006194 [Thelocarpon superellum]
MAFVLRRPFALSSSLSTASRQVPQAFRQAVPARSWQLSQFYSTAPFAASRSRTHQPGLTLARLPTTLQHAWRRPYNQQTYQLPRPDTANLTQRLLYGAGIVGGTVVAINLIFNRETREDGGMPLYERQYLNDTFLHTGLGVGIIGIAASAMHQSGWSYRLMAMNPWAVIGVSLAASIGTMYATFATPPDNYVQKYAFWGAFNVTQAAVLSPLLFMQPALLARAGLYTLGMMGSIAFVGATAKQEKYLYLGGPLLAGVAVVAISGFAPLVLPATAVRTLMWTENIWLYGGLAVFGGFTLYDVQKVLHHARLAQRGLVQKDVVNESISLELDFLNIFIRMVQILGMRNNNRR